MAAANAYLKPWDSLPTQLSSAYTPLAAKPAPGGTVIKLVNGTIPSDGQSYQQEAIAAHAIGWTAKEIVFDGTVADLNAKFLQAVSEKPTAIAVSGWPPAALQRPLAAAKAAGVMVALNSVSDLATSYPGYASNTNGAATAKEIGELNAYMFMRDFGLPGVGGDLQPAVPHPRDRHERVPGHGESALPWLHGQLQRSAVV